MAAWCISRALCALLPGASFVPSLQVEQTVYWTPSLLSRKDKVCKWWAQGSFCVTSALTLCRKTDYCSWNALEHGTCLCCRFSAEWERKLMGGIRWEVMSGYWNGSQCALLPLQIQRLIMFVLSQRGVLSCLRFPVLRERGECTQCFLWWVVCSRLSLWWGTCCGLAGRTARWDQCRQCPEEKNLAFVALEGNALNSEGTFQWQSVLQHLGAQFCIF